jgi:hypothetical protein
MILDATRPATGNLVSPSTCSPCRRRSLTTRAGCRSKRTRATAAGKILDATRAGPPATWSTPRRAHHAGDDRSPRGPAADRSGPGRRPREDPRRHAGRLPSWSAPRHAHHGGRLPIDADQVTRPRDDPRRHAAGCRSKRTRATAAGKILDATRAGPPATWSTPRRAHHAGDDRSPRGPAVDRSGPGDTAAGRSSISREMPGPAGARQPRGGPRGKGASKLSPFALATARARRVFPVKFRGWGVNAGAPPSGPSPGVDPRGAPGVCCFRARAGFSGSSSSSLFLFPWSNPRRGPGPRPRDDPRRHAGRSAGNLVSPSTCSPCRRRSLTTRAGCRSKRTRATAAGKILDATRPGRRSTRTR